MSSVINTNINSLTAQNNLARTQSQLQVSIQRLSSGLRINNAADDAAGLAIVSRFTAQVNGDNQAVINANDGSSLAQTADSALASVTDNLQRIRTLAVESANATNSASDRAALQAEVTQRVQEIDRVATQTSFNGVNLIDGSFQAQQFQVGANAGQTITVANLSSARTASLGQTYSATVVGSGTLTALATGDLQLNGNIVGASLNTSAGAGNAGQTADSAFAIANAINAAYTGVTATANATTTTGGAAVAATAGDSGGFTINGVAITLSTALVGTAATDQATFVQSINNASAATGVTATVAAGNKITLTAADGRDIAVAYTAGGTNITATDTGITATGGSPIQGTITLTTTNSSGITIAGTTPAHAGFSAGPHAAALTGTAISNIDISTVAGANAALASVDGALTQINAARSQLGAIENRFQSVVANLQSTATNLSAARSQIQDADFAVETANYTRGQILQQAGTAILAQANSLPNSVLTLLK